MEDLLRVLDTSVRLMSGRDARVQGARFWVKAE